MTKVNGSISRRAFFEVVGLAGTSAAVIGLAGCSGGAPSSSTAAASSASSHAASAASASASAQQQGPVTKPVGKSLVAFFSRAGENYGVGVVEEGNTAIVAHMIAGKVVSDTFEIVPVEPYPEGYDACLAQAKNEQNAKARPALAESLDNLADYETIYLGYPIWHSDLPMVVYAFLESQNWQGKTIAPFCTHGDSGIGSTVATLKAVCKGATVKDGLAIKGETAQNDRDQAELAVNEWLAKVRS